MPGTSGLRPVALATAVISTIVLEPSTNSTSMRGFMLRARASFSKCVGRRVEFESIVLALAGRDDLEAERLSETDEFDRRRRLVSGRASVDDAGLARLFLEEAADRDVGLDVQHDDVLAVLHRVKREERADIRVAGGVDNHVDAPGRAKRTDSRQ